MLLVVFCERHWYILNATKLLDDIEWCVARRQVIFLSVKLPLYSYTSI